MNALFYKKISVYLPAPERMAIVVAAVALATPSSNAGVLFDQDVTNNVIVGSGVTNGGFTVDQSNGIELGLRGRVRFNASNQPENTFNSNGAGTYTFQVGQPAGGGFGFASGSSSTANWNFDWSINSDYLGTGGLNLDDLTYQLDIDFDPTAGTNFLSFDPIARGLTGQDYDHAFGTNATAQSAGTTGTTANYAGLIASNNLAQNSWNLEFFDSPTFPFNANVPGVFDIRLTAFDSVGAQLAQTQIQVNTVPEPASILTFAGLGLCAFSMGVRRKRRRALQA